MAKETPKDLREIQTEVVETDLLIVGEATQAVLPPSKPRN
jgi:hypothetical protein